MGKNCARALENSQSPPGALFFTQNNKTPSNANFKNNTTPSNANFKLKLFYLYTQFCTREI